MLPVCWDGKGTKQTSNERRRWAKRKASIFNSSASGTIVGFIGMVGTLIEDRDPHYDALGSTPVHPPLMLLAPSS